MKEEREEGKICAGTGMSAISGDGREGGRERGRQTGRGFLDKEELARKSESGAIPGARIIAKLAKCKVNCVSTHSTSFSI